MRIINNELAQERIDMEAPDKIYVNFPFGETHPWRGPMVTKQGLNHHDTIYIRKDALLEYLQKEYEASKWFYEAHAKPGELHIGKCEAYKQVIDKIESL